MPKASPGWNISELKGNDNLSWFVELVEKPTDVIDNFWLTKIILYNQTSSVEKLFQKPVDLLALKLS